MFLIRRFKREWRWKQFRKKYSRKVSEDISDKEDLNSNKKLLDLNICSLIKLEEYLDNNIDNIEIQNDFNCIYYYLF